MDDKDKDHVHASMYLNPNPVKPGPIRKISIVEQVIMEDDEETEADPLLEQIKNIQNQYF